MQLSHSYVKSSNELHCDIGMRFLTSFQKIGNFILHYMTRGNE